MQSEPKVLLWRQELRLKKDKELSKIKKLVTITSPVRDIFSIFWHSLGSHKCKRTVRYLWKRTFTDPHYFCLFHYVFGPAAVIHLIHSDYYFICGFSFDVQFKNSKFSWIMSSWWAWTHDLSAIWQPSQPFNHRHDPGSKWLQSQSGSKTIYYGKK